MWGIILISRDLLPLIKFFFSLLLCCFRLYCTLGRIIFYGLMIFRIKQATITVRSIGLTPIQNFSVCQETDKCGLLDCILQSVVWEAESKNLYNLHTQEMKQQRLFIVFVIGDTVCTVIQ